MLLLAGAALTSMLSAHLQLSGLRFVAVGGDPVPAGAPILVRIHARADRAAARVAACAWIAKAVRASCR